MKYLRGTEYLNEKLSNDEKERRFSFVAVHFMGNKRF